MVRGESYSFGIRFNDDFELTRLDELQLYIGAILVGKLSNGSIKYQDGYYRVELAGATTNKLALGVNPITLYIDDRRRGILKPNVGTITITATQADTDCSVNTGFNSIINVKIDESGVTTDLVLLNAVRGKSAYEYAIDAGYTRTETQFYEDLAIVGNKVDYLIPLTPEEAIAFQSENSRGGFAKLSTALLVYYQGNQIGSIDANLASLERLNIGNLVLKTLNYLATDSITTQNLEAWVTLSIVGTDLVATVNGFITIGDDLDRVKYEGATRNLDLGEQSLETTSVIYKEVAPTVKVPLQRYYDAESNTTKFVRLDGGETNDNQEIGGEFTNVDSIELVEKTLVSAVPLSGNRKGMARLDISSKTSVENFLGMITVPSVPINGKGLVTFTGEVDANTSGTLENSVVYAGVEPGSIDFAPPAKGYYTVHIGTVVVSAVPGKIFLKPYKLPKLNDLSDVNNNATEGQPIVKKADNTWQGSDTIKIEKVIPPSGTHTVEGNQTVSATQTAKDFSGETLGLSGKATINEIESTTGFKKTGATNSDLLTGAGGKLSITTLKSGIYQLFNPTNNTQVVLEVNAAGEVLVHGPIVQTGSGHTVDFETITTKEQLVELRHDATTGMAIGDLAGFVIKLYDGVNDGMMVIDKDGIMRIGDVGDLQPLLTREEAPVDMSPMIFNESTKRAETVKSTDTKVSVVDADAILLKDSQDNNKPKWWSIASIKSTLAFYFDTFYLRLADVTQTVAGKITFSKSPVVPNPVNANEALNKGTADTNYVPKDGDVTINNVKTFTTNPVVPNGATGQQAINHNDAVAYGAAVIAEVEEIVGLPPVEVDAIELIPIYGANDSAGTGYRTVTFKTGNV